MKTLTIVAISQDFSTANPSGAALLRVMNALADAQCVVCIGGSVRPLTMNRAITYVRAFVPPRCGMLAGFLGFHLSHLLVYAWLRIRGLRADVVQTVDAESLLGTVSTFHCCDAALLDASRRCGAGRQRGLAGLAASLQSRLLSRLRIAIQKHVCRSSRTRAIIALSQGSSRDIQHWYRPCVPLTVVPNSLP